MSKWNTETMHASLKKAGFEGETYTCPIYGIVKNNSFFASRYNNQNCCYVAISDYKRLLFVEFAMLTGAPIRMGALGFDDLISAKVAKNIIGQYKFTFVFNINGKKQKFIIRAAKKVYGTDLDEQEQNLMGFVQFFENLGHKLEY